MIREMEILSIITTLFFITSCNQPARNEKLSSSDIEISQEIQVKMDSVIVKYWKNTEANEFRFYYTKGLLHISSEYFGFEKKIEDEHIKNRFLTYVNDLYVSKKPIVLSKKNEPAPTSDYSIITAIGYFKEKKVFEKKTTLYSNLEFNTKFLEFYEFLDSLVKQK